MRNDSWLQKGWVLLLTNVPLMLYKVYNYFFTISITSYISYSASSSSILSTLHTNSPKFQFVTTDTSCMKVDSCFYYELCEEFKKVQFLF